MKGVGLGSNGARAHLDHKQEVRRLLVEPLKLCKALGLDKGAKRQSSGVLVRCPAHGERNPSCSVTRGPDGTIRVRCFSCDFSGDSLSLIAAVHGLPLRGQGFQESLALGAELGGDPFLAREIRSGRPCEAQRKPTPVPTPLPVAQYPRQAEVVELLGQARPAASDEEASAYLRSRGIDPPAVDGLGLARVIPPETSGLPRWASFRGDAERSRPWTETGHRLLVRAFDHLGHLRSVRAWRVCDGDTPTRLPPAGCRATGLVLLNREAWRLLARGTVPPRLVVCEGEPDFLSAACVAEPGLAVLGIVNGSWSPDFAARVPSGLEVVIRTHNDKAGDAYAAFIAKSLKGRCQLRRVVSCEFGDDNDRLLAGALPRDLRADTEIYT